MTIRDLLDQRTDAFGLLKRVFDDLLQVNAVAGRLGKLMAVLLDLVHVEQQRGQLPIELARNRHRRLAHRRPARRGKLGDFGVIEGGSAVGPARKRRIREAVFVLRHVRCLTELTWFRS